MTKSAIFTAAHATAKATRGNFSSYKAAFSAALKSAYSQSKNNTTMTVSQFFGEVRNFNGKIYQDKFIYVDNQKVEATQNEINFSKIGFHRLWLGVQMSEKRIAALQQKAAMYKLTTTGIDVLVFEYGFGNVLLLTRSENGSFQEKTIHLSTFNKNVEAGVLKAA